MTFSALLQTILNAIKAGLLTAEVPPLVTFLENTAKLDLLSLPGQLGYVAQLDLLRSAMMAPIPSLVQAEVVAINTLLTNELEAVLQKALASVQAPTVPPAPSAAHP